MQLEASRRLVKDKCFAKYFRDEAILIPLKEMVGDGLSWKKQSSGERPGIRKSETWMFLRA